MPKTYFSDLDALRFFAFLIVFFAHCLISENETITHFGLHNLTFFLIRVGHNGLSMFFVLSGFLISYLLFEEHSTYNKINLLKYYQRRVLRIFPLYFTLLCFLFYAYPYILKQFFDSNVTAHVTTWKYFVFLNNYDLISKGANIPSLVILWSVAVEVQFYLVWPIGFILFRRHPHYLIILSLLISILYRGINFSNPDLLHFHSLSCLNDLSIGSFLAYLYFYQKTRITSILTRIKKIHLYIFYTLFTLYLVFWAGNNYSNAVEIILDRIIVCIGFAFIILEQIAGNNSILKLRNSAILGKLGAITYGLYCFHYLSIGLVFRISNILGTGNNIAVFILCSIIALFITIATAFYSFRYFESRFLRLKKY